MTVNKEGYIIELRNRMKKYIKVKKGDVMNKKGKLVLATFGILFISLVIGIILYINISTQDPEWGITLRVEDVSSSGLVLHMNREDESTLQKISTGDAYGLEQFTMLGWKGVNISVFTTAIKYLVTEDYSKTWTVDWGEGHGRLSIGLYRISKDVTIEGVKPQELKYYALFFVASWWEVLLILIIAAFLIVLLRTAYRHNLWKKVKVLIERNKRVLTIVLSIVVAMVISVLLVMDYFAAEITSAQYGYDISAMQISAEHINAKITYHDDGDDIKESLICRDKYCIEKKTFLGWSKLSDVEQEEKQNVTSIQEGTSQSYKRNWKEICGELAKGTYRIKQPGYIYRGSGKQLSEVTIYIGFTVNE